MDGEEFLGEGDECRHFWLAACVGGPLLTLAISPILCAQPRSDIMRLVSEIASAGLSPFGHVLVQFMIVWQR